MGSWATGEDIHFLSSLLSLLSLLRRCRGEDQGKEEDAGDLEEDALRPLLSGRV